MNILETIIPIPILRLIGDYVDNIARITHGYGSPTTLELISKYISDNVYDETVGYKRILNCAANLGYYLGSADAKFIENRQVDYEELMLIIKSSKQQLDWNIIATHLHDSRTYARNYIDSYSDFYSFIMTIDIFLDSERINVIGKSTNPEIFYYFIDHCQLMSYEHKKPSAVNINELLVATFNWIKKDPANDILCKSFDLAENWGSRSNFMDRVNEIKDKFSEDSLEILCNHIIEHSLNYNDHLYKRIIRSPNRDSKNVFELAVLLCKLLDYD